MAIITKYEGRTGLSFQVRYRIDGKQKTMSFRAVDNTKAAAKDAERLAKAFMKEIEAQKTLGVAKIESNMTFKEYADRFFKIHIINKKEGTINNYKIHLKKLNEIFGHKKLVDITPSQLDEYFLHLKQNGLKMATIKKYKDMLNLVLKSAYKKDIIEHNPLNKIDFTFHDPNERVKEKLITIDDYKILFSSFHTNHYKFLLMMGLLTGMRTGEMCALRWRDIDFNKKEIKVRKTLTHQLNLTTPKTKSSIREIYMYDQLLLVITSIKDEVDKNKGIFGKDYLDHDLVICKQNGDFVNPRQVAKTFYEKSKTYGINFNMHNLRHTFATLMQDSNIKDLQSILGHSKADVTVNTYQHKLDIKEATIDKLNTVFTDFLK